VQGAKQIFFTAPEQRPANSALGTLFFYLPKLRMATANETQGNFKLQDTGSGKVLTSAAPNSANQPAGSLVIDGVNLSNHQDVAHALLQEKREKKDLEEKLKKFEAAQAAERDRKSKEAADVENKHWNSLDSQYEIQKKFDPNLHARVKIIQDYLSGAPPEVQDARNALAVYNARASETSSKEATELAAALEREESLKQALEKAQKELSLHQAIAQQAQPLSENGISKRFNVNPVAAVAAQQQTPAAPSPQALAMAEFTSKKRKPTEQAPEAAKPTQTFTLEQLNQILQYSQQQQQVPVPIKDVPTAPVVQQFESRASASQQGGGGLSSLLDALSDTRGIDEFQKTLFQ
jgi:hypothetical protein